LFDAHHTAPFFLVKDLSLNKSVFSQHLPHPLDLFRQQPGEDQISAGIETATKTGKQFLNLLEDKVRDDERKRICHLIGSSIPLLRPFQTRNSTDRLEGC